jgi:integrase
MEYVEGETLHRLLRREGTLPVKRAVKLLRQIADGVEAAHDAGILHRDLKPANMVMQELRRHRIRQNEERLKLGASWHQNDFVFPSEIGTPLNPPNVTRHFKRILKKAEIRTSIRLYDLRHTTATLLLQAGINPKIVSERLGHATIVLTLDTYSHVLPNMQRDATDQLEQMIFRKNGTL